ncbi:MAG: hypothetical protein ACAI44_08390 [Candidatus Sericytochromatia bacterium]
MDQTNPLQAEARASGLQAFGEHRWDDAIAAYGEALTLGEDAGLLADLGAAYQSSWRLARAAELYRRALELEPGHLRALGNLASACLVMLEQEQALTYRAQVLELLADRPASREAVDAFADYIFTCTSLWPFSCVATEIRRLSELHLRPFYPTVARPAPALASGRRIRLGYLSGDFNQHSVMDLLEPLFVQADRERFEIFCYYTASRRDNLTAWLERHTRFRSIRGHSDKQAALLMRRDELDLLVDLSGYTSGRRLALLARHPAPRVATGLGCIMPLGFAGSDYALLDRRVFREADAGLVPETLLRIPANMFYRPQPQLELRAPGHQELVFGCANSLYKLTPQVQACWAEILRQLPEAVLSLKARALADPEVLARLRQGFGVLGIGPERIRASGQSPRPEVMAWYHGVDICLDPFPYQGGLTSSEALYMGCPVISLDAGGINTSVSILDLCQLKDDITATPADYIRRAVALGQSVAAMDPGQRLGLRRRIRDSISRSIVFDPQHFVASLEAAYEFICSRPGD